MKNLTERQVEVLKLIADGQSHEEIGEKLYFSRSTVKREVLILLTKLGASNAPQAVATAFRLGILK